MILEETSLPWFTFLFRVTPSVQLHHLKQKHHRQYRVQTKPKKNYHLKNSSPYTDQVVSDIFHFNINPVLQRCWYSVRIALSPDKHTYNSVVRLSGNVQIRLGCTCICTINPNGQPENPGDYIIIIAASLCSRQHFHCHIIIVIIVFVSICITFHPSLLHAVFFIHFSLFFI